MNWGKIRAEAFWILSGPGRAWVWVCGVLLGMEYREVWEDEDEK